MSRAERDKGKRGELEVAELLREHGFEARRDGRLDDDLVHDVAGVHVEVKRREHLAIPAWWRDTATAATAAGRRPLLAFRSSRQPWLAVVELDHLAGLLADRRRLGDVLELLRQARAELEAELEARDDAASDMVARRDQHR